MYGDLYQDVVRSGFEVLHEHIPITVAVEDTSIDQLVLVILETTLSILLSQEGVRIFTLRILVQHREIGMRRCGIEVVVILLDVFSVVAFGIAQTVQSLLQDWISPIPERECQAQSLFLVAESGQTVLAPSICSAPRLIVVQIAPGAPITGVVLADGAPLAFTDVGSP